MIGRLLAPRRQTRIAGPGNPLGCSTHTGIERMALSTIECGDKYPPLDARPNTVSAKVTSFRRGSKRRDVRCRSFESILARAYPSAEHRLVAGEDR